MNTWKGRCFCGAVELEVSGTPADMGYCHCESCRGWSAAPVNGFILWHPEDVRVVRGGDHIRTYTRSGASIRKWCETCGGHLMNEHPVWGLIDVYAGILVGFPFQPKVHVNLDASVLSIADDLPRFRDFPVALGGTGRLTGEMRTTG